MRTKCDGSCTAVIEAVKCCGLLSSGGEIVSTFDMPESVKLGRCDLIEEIMIGEDRLIKFSGLSLSCFLELTISLLNIITFVFPKYCCLLCPRPHRAEALSDDARLTSVCWTPVHMSRTSGLSQELERPRKTKIGTGVAHVTRDWETIFKVMVTGVGVYCGSVLHSLLKVIMHTFVRYMVSTNFAESELRTRVSLAALILTGKNKLGVRR